MPVKSVTSKAGKVENKEDKANSACTTAIQLLQTVIQLLEEGKLSENQWKIFNQIFCLEESNQTIAPTIINILKATLVGLDGTQFNLIIEFYNSAKKSQGDTIAIALAQFNSAVQFVRYLIHEATHAFAGTDDHTDRGYINNDGNYRAAGLTHEEALKNADSYAVLVMLLSGYPLK